jgi:two-component system phosphate regulon sensor histidine kinase PhoR
MHHVRAWLAAISAAAALAAGIACHLLLRSAEADEPSLFASAPLAAALATFAIVMGTGLFVRERIHRALGELAAATQNVVRDTNRRVPTVAAPPDDELRKLAEWVNFLAEDAERGHRALARERVLLATVAEGLTQGVIAVDAEHRIELLNDAARKMLQVSSTPVGEPLIEFVRVPQVFALIEGDEAATAEVQLASGARTLIRVARRTEHDGRVLLLEDVTAMRRLETVRRDFVANVSHELRTPVAIIRANAETLRAGAKDDPAMAGKLIEGLHRNSERLARILADLLDLSRLDAGQYRLELAAVPVNAAIEQALTAVEPSAARRGVHIEVAAPAELAVHADPKALDQILVNLIDNAIKYTRPEGHVWVAARRDPGGDRDGEFVRIEVRDDGPGIADKHRERVFERFYRADPSRAREAGGTGLGLSIVKHLVESMDGTVGVEPNEPSGSIFWLRLPAGGSISP